jgi:hypothetical protein
MRGRSAFYGSLMNKGLTIADAETGEETYLGVGVVRDGLVGLAASQRSRSEMEVFLGGADAIRSAEPPRVAGTVTTPDRGMCGRSTAITTHRIDRDLRHYLGPAPGAHA